jgi:hypothetical protein
LRASVFGLQGVRGNHLRATGKLWHACPSWRKNPGGDRCTRGKRIRRNYPARRWLGGEASGKGLGHGPGCGAGARQRGGPRLPRCGRRGGGQRNRGQREEEGERTDGWGRAASEREREGAAERRLGQGTAHAGEGEGREGKRAAWLRRKEREERDGPAWRARAWLGNGPRGPCGGMEREEGSAGPGQGRESRPAAGLLSFPLPFFFSFLL